MNKGTRILREFFILAGIATPPVLLAGAVGALFLAGLEWVTDLRFDHNWIIFTLPLLGIISVLIYRLQPNASGGNKLLFGAIRTGREKVPLLLAPLIFIGTLLTHLGGGSAGREGTALQIGGGLAGGWCSRLGISSERTRFILLAGAAAGFSAVFGTPLTAAIFVLEVSGIRGGMLRLALPLCLAAAYAGDATAIKLGAGHEKYSIGNHTGISWFTLIPRIAIAGVAFGLAATLFSKMLHGVTGTFTRLFANEYLRITVGAGLLIALTLAIGTRNYLGIGTYPDPQDSLNFTMRAAFVAGGVTTGFWFWKVLFTTLTLGVGFKGGEVTPLFIIGASLGNALAGPLGLPVDLMAGLGLVAVFTGAAKTPLAGIVLGVEMFGIEYAPHFAIVCVIVQLIQRRPGLYDTGSTTTPATLTPATH